MHKKCDLTVILTLRGRHLHTLRWLWHANSNAFPYHVIIADGEVHPTIARLLSDPLTFPNLSFEYHRYRDLTFTDFYKKCADAARKVRTPYVMLSDNDDFPIVPGIEKSIELLERNPEYICAGGQIPHFLIDPRPDLPGQVVGEMVDARFGYNYRCRDFSVPSLSERVLDEINDYQVIYYHVYRADALRTIQEEVEAQDFSDLTVHEYFMALRAITLGKIASRPSVICYLRQRGTSSGFSYRVDWVHHLLRSRLPQDFQAMATTIADEVHKRSGEDASTTKEDILDAYAVLLRAMLGNSMMRYRFPRLFQIKQKLLWLRDLHVVPLSLRRRWSDRKFFARVAQDCVDPALVSAYRTAFANVKATLQGDGFLSFVRIKAPDLVPGVNDLVQQHPGGTTCIARHARIRQD